MLKFVFIINMPNCTPEDYSAIYSNDKSHSIVAGIGIDKAAGYVSELAEQGFSLVNLCGDFDDEATEAIRSAAGNKIEVYHSQYTDEELRKLESLDALQNYGLIIAMDGVDTPQKYSLLNEECNTEVVFVKDLQQAKVAAGELVDDGIDFIELCSWFDEDKTGAVIGAIGGAVPIGSCGL